MKSWIMKGWLKTHNKKEHPDLSITQGNDAFHVLPESRHPPEESIKRMCSRVFCSHYENRFVQRPMDFGLKESGNPPPYYEPVLKHSQACVAKVVTSNEDLVSCDASPGNGRMRSRDTEKETLNPLYEKATTASGTEGQNLVYAEQNVNTTETHH